MWWSRLKKFWVLGVELWVEGLKEFWVRWGKLCLTLRRKRRSKGTKAIRRLPQLNKREKALNGRSYSSCAKISRSGYSGDSS